MTIASRARRFIEDNLLLTILLLAAAAFALVGGYALFLQAQRAGVDWKTWFIIGCYCVLGLVSLIVPGRRARTLTLRLKRIPQKEHNAPPEVRLFIQDEYWRTAAIAYASQPKGYRQKGWGAPGTVYEGVYFRRAILDTVPTIDAQARVISPNLPILKPHTRLAHHLRTLARLFPENRSSCLQAYDASVQLARYSMREPTEAEFEKGIQAYQEIFDLLAEFKDDIHYQAS